MSKELFTKFQGDLKARSDWEVKQRIWLEMRTTGLKRRNRPFPNASDLHFPLIDTIIEKTKPFYAQQLVGQEMLASFISFRDQSQELTTSAARCFDYKMRHESDFIIEQLYAVDTMLQSDKGILKVYWDTKKKRLGFDAIEPMMIIVPASTKKLQDADRVCQVLQLSVEQYKLLENYNQDEGYIKRITGGNDEAPDSAYETERDSRQGIVRDGISGADDGEIVIWECWERTKTSWKTSWFSPNCPDEDARPPQAHPYKHGKLPFVEFHMEIKGKGYYDSRGISQVCAPYETSTCKMWNEKHDFMAFVNRPLFQAEKALPQGQQMSFRPGALLPFGVSRVDMGNPPFALNEEISFNRQTAEQRIGQPDYALSKEGGKDPRTATEITQVSQMSMQSVDLRAIIFRLSETEVFEQAWGLLVQFDEEAMYLDDEQKYQALDPTARHLKYKMAPSGNVDSWNKTLSMQKAITRFQMFKDNPFINQGELIKSILVLDDPQLIRTLFQEPEQAMLPQAEEQAGEILLLERSFPVAVEANDNHAVHIRTLAQYMQAQALKGVVTPEEVLNAFRQHIEQHMQMMAASGPQGRQQAQASQQEVGQILAQTQQMLAQAQPQLGGGNVVPMQQPQPAAL